MSNMCAASNEHTMTKDKCRSLCAHKRFKRENAKSNVTIVPINIVSLCVCQIDVPADKHVLVT